MSAPPITPQQVRQAALNARLTLVDFLKRAVVRPVDQNGRADQRGGLELVEVVAHVSFLRSGGRGGCMPGRYNG